jgi:cell division GTPase FtsZ
MKLSVIGLGQCGCNITDEFYAVNSYAMSILNGRVEILTDAFAINTDEADLGAFKHIPKDKGHRILIGTMATFGHGVGKMNVDAVNIIKASNSVVTDTILRSRKFHESDAIMTIASGGGGTGSGIIGWLIKALKERVDKPIYAIVILPFAFEERGDTSYAVMNTATCINTVSRHADATFLVDNERYRRAGSNLARNFQEINKEIASSFYDLCCAGEEKRQKYVGSKVMDAGDIKQSLEGITTLGLGQVDLPTFQWRKDHFREGIREQSAVLVALSQAEANSGLSIKLEDARRILVLISAPKDAISTATLEEISNSLQEKAPRAVIRIGDYPRRAKEVSVTLINSQLTKVPRLEHLFVQAEDLLKKQQEIKTETETKIERMFSFSRNVPVLD